MMPELAVTQKRAAEMLGISVNHFKVHVRPHLKAVYIGDVVRYRVRDLEAWLARSVK